MAPSKPLHYHSIRCTRRDLMLLDCGFKKSSPYDYAEIEHRAIVKCKERMHRLALGKLAYLQVCSQLLVEMVI